MPWYIEGRTHCSLVRMAHEGELTLVRCEFPPTSFGTFEAPVGSPSLWWAAIVSGSCSPHPLDQNAFKKSQEEGSTGVFLLK